LLRFANVDRRLLVWVDRSLPFGDGVAYGSPAEAGPFANDLQPASVAARQAELRVRKLKLWRDTYYTLRPGSGDAPLAAEDWSNPDRWQPLRELPVETLYVQPGHYLCLGDNSPESSDGRSWGLVPQRLLLGRALAVYYPFRRIGPIH
jgi:signal peptidase I